MYSRSLDPRRAASPLPAHYSGSAFRSDGTPTPIPVRREPDRQREAREIPETESQNSTREETLLPALSEAKEPSSPPEKADETAKGSDDEPFVSRLLHGVLPGIREDDLLLVLLILLLAGEEDSGDALLLLAVLLLGK